MFIDSSAFVSILTLEPEHEALADAIERASARFTSGLVRLETVMRVSTKLRTSPDDAETAFERLIAAGEIDVVPITDEIAKAAVRAFAKYGKGRGHPAQLNIADCMHYAAAKWLRAPMLFVGEDFSKTDLKSARSLAAGA